MPYDSTQHALRTRTDYFQKLSSKLKSKLGEFLLLIAEEEQKIERQRQVLARISDFEPYACFTRVDRGNAGVICSKDIVHFMIENRRGISEFDCNYVIKFFDSTFQGWLNYQDFMQIILPCDDSLLRTQATQQR